LLRSRGLTITNEGRARHYLRFIGYYRLSGYALVFQVNYNADGSHRFHPGANFDDIVDLCIFDRKLRLAVMDALERIEVAVRASLSHEMSISHGTHWFMDAAPFVPNYDHANFLEHVKKEIGHDPARAHARQVFIQHYYDKYRHPELPPSWMVFEVLSFGTVSQVFKKLKRENQKPVAKVFGLDGGVLASWLHTITHGAWSKQPRI
jgi:abortive infection bacteriophage resistance protein